MADSPRFTARLHSCASLRFPPHLLLAALAVGDDTYEPCPAYPPLAPAASVAADPQFQAALRNATSPSRRRRCRQASPPPSCTTTASCGAAASGCATSSSPAPARCGRATSCASRRSPRRTPTRCSTWRDAGTVGLDDELATHLPGFSMRNPYGTVGKGRSATSRATSPASRARCRGRAPSISTGAPRATSREPPQRDARPAAQPPLPLLQPGHRVAQARARARRGGFGIAALVRGAARGQGADSARHGTPPGTRRRCSRPTSARSAPRRPAISSTSAIRQPTPGAPGGWGGVRLPLGVGRRHGQVHEALRDDVPAGASPSQILDGDTLRRRCCRRCCCATARAQSTPWRKHSSGVWMKANKANCRGTARR